MAMVKILLVFFAAIFYCTNNQPSVNNGFVVFQAEDALNIGQDSLKWNIDSTISGYSGTAYLHFLGDSEYPDESKPYLEENRNRVLTYKFHVDNPGKYYVKVYNYHFLEDGDNDCWISVNNGEWVKTYDHNANEWSWDETGTWNEYILNTGTNIVEVAGRSHNFLLDKLVVFHEDLAPKPFDKHQNAVWYNK